MSFHFAGKHRDGLRHGLPVADVQGDDMGCRPERGLELGGKPRKPVPAPGGEDELRSLCRERLGAGQADPRACSGDEYDFIL